MMEKRREKKQLMLKRNRFELNDREVEVLCRKDFF